jgi:transposase
VLGQDCYFLGFPYFQGEIRYHATEAWCNGHADAFSYFGGCPQICVPDNPKAVVTKACRYEPDVNPSFARMAAFYNIAVIPARVRKPKDKSKVEASVGLATRWILLVLRRRTFFSLAEARAAVRCENCWTS